MNKTFAIGSKIKISENYHWAKNVLGEIAAPPEHIVENSEGWKGIVREVKSLKGNLLFYWVKFDEPQIDNNNDGPYHQAEIDSNYLSLII